MRQGRLSSPRHRQKGVAALGSITTPSFPVRPIQLPHLRGDVSSRCRGAGLAPAARCSRRSHARGRPYFIGEHDTRPWRIVHHYVENALLRLNLADFGPSPSQNARGGQPRPYLQTPAGLISRNSSGIHNGTSGQVKRRPQASMALRRASRNPERRAVNRVRHPEFRRIFLLAIYLSSRLVGLCAIRAGSIPDSVTEPVPRRLIDPGRQRGHGRADRDTLD